MANRGRIIGLSCGVLALLAGIGLIVIGAVIPSLINQKIQEGLQTNVQLTPGSPSYGAWVNNTQTDSQPQFQKFYFFNVTNADQVLSGSAKPSLKEVGPYVYRKWIVRYNISQSQNGEEVKFKTYTYFTFDSQKSNGDPHADNITTVNLPYQGVSSQLGSEWWERLLSEAIAGFTHSPAFTTRSVHELIWGYNDTLLQFLDENLHQAIDPFTFLQLNQTSLDDSDMKTKYDTVKTGTSDLKQVLQYVQFQEDTFVPFWGSKEANKVEGTDGTMFDQGLAVGQTVKPWIDIAWRTLVLKAVENINSQGVDLVRLKLDSNDFENATIYPSNADYYQFGPRGVGNLTSVFKGTPIFLSSPHFLDADPFYLNGVDGLSPNRSIHETSIDVEPVTGITLQVAKRLQIVCQMKSSIVSNPDFKPVYVPVMWVDLTSQLTNDTAKQFLDTNEKLTSAHSASNGAKYGGYISGVVLILIALALFAFIGRSIMKERSNGYSAIQ